MYAEGNDQLLVMNEPVLRRIEDGSQFKEQLNKMQDEIRLLIASQNVLRRDLDNANKTIGILQSWVFPVRPYPFAE